ncbi:NADH-cytochrome b5 reductase [Trichoglossum hirsutum]|uniref:NADH-cytochrome b5 reductase n=1 Tax=Trichoglossum hirsutum TaxID=265104 RepID=A0A9P8RT77_9PEZI|nr:NADH-cytochrome b5 reductase [Trichoglossum hirsutum]
MFARQAFRSALQPMKTSFHRYSTEAPKSGGINTLLIAGVVGAVGAGGYYYYNTTVQSETVIPQGPSKADPAFIGGDQGWIGLKLESIETVNHNTKKLRFALPHKDNVSGLHVALINFLTAALLTKYKGPGDEKPTIRPYTPISAEDARGYLDLLVKVYPNGPMSSHLHSMNVDQRLDFKGPIPKYPWEANKHDHVALIAGGTGITPMYQLTRAIFSNPNDKTKVTLVFGNISEEDILLKREFEDLENTYPQRFRAFYLLDKPPASWTGGKGYVTKELLKAVIPGPKDGNIKVFVCGPPGLYKAVSGEKRSPQDQGELSGILQELGYSKDQVYKF